MGEKRLRNGGVVRRHVGMGLLAPSVHTLVIGLLVLVLVALLAPHGLRDADGIPRRG
jgi:hypothetical protein